MAAGFRSIAQVPTCSDIFNRVLGRCQSETPVGVHNGWAISRIRTFYVRKLRFIRRAIDEILRAIVEAFPVIDEVHPFYADLINVLCVAPLLG